MVYIFNSHTSVDKVIESLEQRAEDELRTLDELLNALIDKLGAQAKFSDKIIERKILDVDKLCGVRREIISTVADMTDDVAVQNAPSTCQTPSN
eukprot:NODE_1911_length_814_cov_163.222222_g1511_i0.p1 GENE.NODE_1911_length_814_cov_163.222222_g1511_i0~~NODE_1911_length_814_cov_163.222222_g1511_i0.p1  ORF type:complete len:94 (+),score=21.05 NODE_1911_length_814_cov_163.222222_g1511_i0:434-715(+)